MFPTYASSRAPSIKASACADRDLIVQRQSSGYLLKPVMLNGRTTDPQTGCTYVTIPSDMQGSILIGLPLSSSGGVMLKTCNADAMFTNSASSA